MKVYDPLRDDPKAIAALESRAVKARQESEQEQLAAKAQQEEWLAMRAREELRYQQLDYTLEERAIIQRYATATSDELEELRKSDKLKALHEKWQRHSAVTPGLAEVIAQALLNQMPQVNQSNVEALQFVIYGLAQIAARPEVKECDDVLSVVVAVHDALSSLTIFQADRESIANAFAMPAQSERNARAASKLRTDESLLEEAHALYLRWVENPNLYPTKTAFARDMVTKELCHDMDTPKRWLVKWTRDLDPMHPLWKKVAAKSRNI